MNSLRCLAMFGLVTGLSVSASGSAAQPAKPHHGVHGVVEVVHHKHHTFTVHVHHAKGAKTAHHGEHKFHVNHNTVIVIDGKHHKHASFAALHHGEHVVVHTAGGHPHLATRIDIQRHQHTQLARK